MTGSWTRRRFALGLLAVASVGIAFRALPLWQSPLPFNPDGLYHARNAQHAVRTGTLPLDLIAVDDLGFGSFLAVVQLLTGVQARTTGQPVVAVVGTLPAVLTGLLARRMSRRLGDSPTLSSIAGLVAGGLLAVGGIYLYRSMPVDEQTLGLVLVPVVLVAVVVAVWHGSRRWLVVAGPPVALLPALHNLDSVVVGLSLVAVVALAVTDGSGQRRQTWLAAVVAVAFWLYVLAYTYSVAELTPASIIQSRRVTAAPGLLLAWVVLGVAGATAFARLRIRTQRVLLLGPLALLFALLLSNAVVTVFPGTTRTTRGVLPVVGLVVPVALAGWGGPLVVRDAENRVVSAVLLVGPLTIIGFALTAALTPVYLGTAIRTHWFLYVPVVALAGTAVAMLFRAHLDGRSLWRAAVLIVVFAAVAASIPTAFGGLAVHNYKGVTTSGEFAASNFAVERVPDRWASDNHLVRITRYRTNGATGQVGPVYDWIHGGADPPDCPVLTAESWTTVGAQFFPRAPEALSPARLRTFERTSHVVYDGGSAGAVRLLVPRNRQEGRC